MQNIGVEVFAFWLEIDFLTKHLLTVEVVLFFQVLTALSRLIGYKPEPNILEHLHTILGRRPKGKSIVEAKFYHSLEFVPIWSTYPLL
jgi:hypothetical protein